MPVRKESFALPRLEAEGVALRWMTEHDVYDLLTVWGDPDVMRFMARPALGGRQEALDFLREIRHCARDRTLYQWGFVRCEDDRVIGTCTLAEISWQNHCCEIGFALAKPFWRQGLTSIAASLVIEHAFTDLGMHRIGADVDPKNHGSLRLLERLGFVREGHLRDRYFQDGEYQDAILLGLLDSEWQALQEQSPIGNAS